MPENFICYLNSGTYVQCVYLCFFLMLNITICNILCLYKCRDQGSLVPVLPITFEFDAFCVKKESH